MLSARNIDAGLFDGKPTIIRYGFGGLDVVAISKASSSVDDRSPSHSSTNPKCAPVPVATSTVVGDARRVSFTLARSALEYSGSLRGTVISFTRSGDQCTLRVVKAASE